MYQDEQQVMNGKVLGMKANLKILSKGPNHELHKEDLLLSD